MRWDMDPVLIPGKSRAPIATTAQEFVPAQVVSRPLNQVDQVNQTSWTSHACNGQEEEIPESISKDRRELTLAQSWRRGSSIRSEMIEPSNNTFLLVIVVAHVIEIGQLK